MALGPFLPRKVLYICVCMFVYIYIHIYIHICIHIYKYIYIQPSDTLGSLKARSGDRTPSSALGTGDAVGDIGAVGVGAIGDVGAILGDAMRPACNARSSMPVSLCLHILANLVMYDSG